MFLPNDFESEFAAFPPTLRDLVLAELEAGNAIAELGHGFPAAPCGAYIRLSRPVSAERRSSTPELSFYDRNCSSYSGEFTDAKRHFFVLEPPHPPEPEPDMDAIRAAAQRPSEAQTSRSPAKVAEPPSRPEPPAASRVFPARPASLLARFEASMAMDYEKWREGIGYDLNLLQEATDDERAAIENLLIHKANRDWRDVEALAALGPHRPRIRAALLEALRHGDATVRMAVHRHAPELLSVSQRIVSLVAALENAEFYGGLTQALIEVQQFHPPEVIDALWRGIREREGGVATHFAAMLYYLYGKASSPFDWDHRPFFLRFNTEDPEERQAAERELRARLAGTQLKRPDTRDPNSEP